MGRGTAEKTENALQVLAGVLMKPLLLDMMIVIVVMAEAFFAKVGMLEGVLMCGVTAVARDKVVELVSSVGVGVKKAN